MKNWFVDTDPLDALLDPEAKIEWPIVGTVRPGRTFEMQQPLGDSVPATVSHAFMVKRVLINSAALLLHFVDSERETAAYLKADKVVTQNATTAAGYEANFAAFLAKYETLPLEAFPASWREDVARARP